MSDAHEGDIVAEDGPSRSGCCAIIREELHELKWGVLVIACFLTFGSYYVFDFPGSIGTGAGNTIEQKFIDAGKAYSQAMNQMLYSVYSWPNTVLAMFGGLLIDKFLGLRRGMVLFTSLILAGSILFYFGVQLVQYPMMLAGRVIFGLGGECLAVSQSAFVARWFRGGRGMALAFGITISFSRVGSSFNFIFSPAIAGRWGVDAAALSGVGACGVSILACMLLVLADMYAVRIGYIAAEVTSAAVNAVDEEGDEDAAGGDEVAESSGKSVMKLSDVYKLPAAYWLLCLICVACYTAVFPFIGISKNFFEVKYGYSPSKASQYVSSYQLTSAAASPIIGFVVDAVGHNSVWLIVASGCFIIVHLLFIFSTIPALALMIGMGAVYGFLVSGLWPSVPWVVPPNMVAFSYGVMTALQNIGLASFPMIVGRVLDHHTDHSPISPSNDSFVSSNSGSNSSDPSPGNHTLPSIEGYLLTEWLFIGAATISLSASVTLLLYDVVQQGGLLSCSSTYRQELLLQLEEERVFTAGSIPESQRGLLHGNDDEEEASQPGEAPGRG